MDKLNDYIRSGADADTRITVSSENAGYQIGHISAVRPGLASPSITQLGDKVAHARKKIDAPSAGPVSPPLEVVAFG